MLIKLLALWLARSPRVIDWLVAFADRHPYYHLYHEDKSLYMGRWWLLPSWALCWNADKECMEPKAWNRGGLWKLVRWSPRLHLIATPDLDRDLHDHPFDYRTIILRGAYVEENVFGDKAARMPGHTASSRAQTFHRIDSVTPGGVLTLFITGPKVQPWGFLVGGRKVVHTAYTPLQTQETRGALALPVIKLPKAVYSGR